MSVYSGFGTRDQETTYNSYISKMFLLLGKRVLWSSKEENYDEDKWKIAFEKIYKNMNMMEKNKYLPPKFSLSLSELAEHFGIRDITEIVKETEIISRNSSRALPRTRNKSDQLNIKITPKNATNTKYEKMYIHEKNKFKTPSKETDHTNLLNSRIKYSKRMPIPNGLDYNFQLKDGGLIDNYSGKATNLIAFRPDRILSKTNHNQGIQLPELSKPGNKINNQKQKLDYLENSKYINHNEEKKLFLDREAKLTNKFNLNGNQKLSNQSFCNNNFDNTKLENDISDEIPEVQVSSNKEILTITQNHHQAYNNLIASLIEEGDDFNDKHPSELCNLSFNFMHGLNENMNSNNNFYIKQLLIENMDNTYLQENSTIGMSIIEKVNNTISITQ